MPWFLAGFTLSHSYSSTNPVLTWTDLDILQSSCIHNQIWSQLVTKQRSSLPVVRQENTTWHIWTSSRLFAFAFFTDWNVPPRKWPHLGQFGGLVLFKNSSWHWGQVPQPLILSQTGTTTRLNNWSELEKSQQRQYCTVVTKPLQQPYTKTVNTARQQQQHLQSSQLQETNCWTATTPPSLKEIKTKYHKEIMKTYRYKISKRQPTPLKRCMMRKYHNLIG